MNKHTLLAFALTCWAAGLLAQVPIEMNYQGYLVDASGNPATGTVNVAIALYTEPVGGMAVYSEAIGAVELNKGIYSFQWGRHGTSVVQAVETMAVTDGSTTIYNYTVANAPMLNPSVTISDGIYSWSDSTGSSHPAAFLGSVSSYESGSVSAVYLSGAPAGGRIITASYHYHSPTARKALNWESLFLALTLDNSWLAPRQFLATVPYSVLSVSSEQQYVLVLGDYQQMSPNTIYYSEHGGIVIWRDMRGHFLGSNFQQALFRIRSSVGPTANHIRLERSVGSTLDELTAPIPAGHYWQATRSAPPAGYTAHGTVWYVPYVLRRLSNGVLD